MLFTADVQACSVITLKLEEWAKMRGEDRALSSEWCAILAAKLSRGKSLLLLCFKKGWLQRQNSGEKAAIPFRAKAYCTFSCCGIHCELHITKDDNDGGDSDVKLHVSQSGTVQHMADERRARRIKGMQRAKLRSELLQHHRSHSAFYNESMHKLPLEHEMELGGPKQSCRKFPVKLEGWNRDTKT